MTDVPGPVTAACHDMRIAELLTAAPASPTGGETRASAPRAKALTTRASSSAAAGNVRPLRLPLLLHGMVLERLGDCEAALIGCSVESSWLV